MVKLVILAIHGIGNAQPDYYDRFERKLKISLKSSNISSDDYIFKGIHYSPIFKETADTISEMTQDLKWKSLRRFFTHSLGDALAYQQGIPSSNRIDYYNRVHQQIDSDIAELEESEKITENTKLLVIGHSLGGYIISNYIWDKQKQFPTSSKFSEMSTLSGIVTMGCNIPILTQGFNPEKLFPISLPGSNVSDSDKIKWVNVYDRYDPLSVPLSNFYNYQNENQLRTIKKIEDVELNVGGILWKYTPLSHTKYWGSKKFIKLVKNQILDLIKLD